MKDLKYALTVAGIIALFAPIYNETWITEANNRVMEENLSRHWPVPQKIVINGNILFVHRNGELYREDDWSKVDWPPYMKLTGTTSAEESAP